MTVEPHVGAPLITYCMDDSYQMISPITVATPRMIPAAETIAIIMLYSLFCLLMTVEPTWVLR